jgi:hypothetical protein
VTRKREYPKASQYTSWELRELPPGTVIEVTLLDGQRLLVKRTKREEGPNEWSPVWGTAFASDSLALMSELMDIETAGDDW